KTTDAATGTDVATGTRGSATSKKVTDKRLKRAGSAPKVTYDRTDTSDRSDIKVTVVDAESIEQAVVPETQSGSGSRSVPTPRRTATADPTNHRSDTPTSNDRASSSTRPRNRSLPSTSVKI